jgi:cob(I)alamin adenosyltransferase
LKIYTKGGDRGETGLVGGARVGKDDPRVAIYGDIDELNSVLGVARAQGLPQEVEAKIERIQAELFTLGSQLATPDPDRPGAQRVQAEWVAAMEAEIDAADAELPRLRNFLLPGGVPGAAQLHLARAVCRRAERALVALGRRAALDPLVEVYVNRLSDWLFVMARAVNHRSGAVEPLWRPPKTS